MKKVLILLLITLLGCTQQTNNINRTIRRWSQSPYVIYIQPYEGFSEKEVNRIIPELNEQFHHWLRGKWEFKVLKPIPLPKVSKYNNKYEALEILDFQLSKVKNDVIIIGLTHEDICKDNHGFKHYGIIGLSYRPGNVCIVSDKRLKDKSQIWKTILHEFMHAYYGAVHCPNDDPTCFMVDAKGKGNLGVQNKLCNACKKQ